MTQAALGNIWLSDGFVTLLPDVLQIKQYAVASVPRNDKKGLAHHNCKICKIYEETLYFL